MKTLGRGKQQQENMNFSETRVLFFMQIALLMKTKGKKIITTVLLTEQIAYLRKWDFKVLPEMSPGFHYLSDNI